MGVLYLWLVCNIRIDMEMVLFKVIKTVGAFCKGTGDSQHIKWSRFSQITCLFHDLFETSLVLHS